MSLLDRLMDLMPGVRERLGLNGNWPPSHLQREWEKIEDYRRRYGNDREKILQFSPHMNANPTRAELFTPVPLARDIARISAQLLFSETPVFREENAQDFLDDLIRENMLASMLQEAGEKVATEGHGALRIVLDDEALPGTPIIDYVPGDQVVWDVRHGRFVRGGVAITTRSEEIAGGFRVWRLLEHHEPGRVTRELFEGDTGRLGKKIPLDSYPEFAGLEESEATMPGVTTLVRWRNTPNGNSDLAGLDAMLDSIDEGATIGRDKMRKSVPKVFADRSLADRQGNVDLDGVILTGGGNIAPDLGANPMKTVETAQPGLESEAHIAYMEHVVAMTLEMAGYSRATWGRDQGGSADSGKALKLRQTRTLMTRAGKERMAKDAISKALAIALAWKHGGKPDAYTVECVFGDGLPNDTLEEAQEIATLAAAEAISLDDKVRRLHPDRDDDAITKEVEAIRRETEGPQPRVPELDVSFERVQ